MQVGDILLLQYIVWKPWCIFSVCTHTYISAQRKPRFISVAFLPLLIITLIHYTAVLTDMLRPLSKLSLKISVVFIVAEVAVTCGRGRLS